MKLSIYMDKSKTKGNWVTMLPLNSMDDFDNCPEFLDKIGKNGEGQV
ncbi:MAG: hypothetical protein V7K48_03535 [Nostoc sp.]